MTNWQEFERRAAAAERQATVMRQAAEQARCNATDTAGVQCTADFFPADHEHVYDDTAEDGF